MSPAHNTKHDVFVETYRQNCQAENLRFACNYESILTVALYSLPNICSVDNTVGVLALTILTDGLM